MMIRVHPPMGIAREPEPLFYAIILECAVLVCPRVSHTRKKIPPSATEAEFFSLLDERAGVRNKDLFRQPRMRRTVHPFFRSRTVFNSLLWIGFAVLDLSVTLAVFRYFGKVGLYALIVFDLLICNIQVLKIISLFGLTTTLGNILYAGVFLATDILSECYGKKSGHARGAAGVHHFGHGRAVHADRVALHARPRRLYPAAP